ncbi:MAG: L-serine ammonia-lyase, iron-sulfur-dependent, subunit alpha [Synergistaceae bacterium]|nr:L-serine ammonia-lyase, iron-sulfur-dependent, subunit alpha [Synergistaceae bacterium]
MLLLKDFLAKEVKPALGCTDPGAVALAVARACKELPDREDVASIRVTVSGSIYKNGMAVGIPGTRGARGNAMAAAMGAICGDPDLGLEVLRNSTAKDVEKAERWVKEERTTIYCDPDRSGVYVLASVFTPEHKAVCLVCGNYNHIEKVIVDGITLMEDRSDPSVSSIGFEDDGFPDVFAEALQMTDDMDEDDKKFLLSGIEMNMAVAEGGFKPSDVCSICGECVQGSRFGRALKDIFALQDNDEVALNIRSVTAAAADARMSGILLPVMSSAGSGNHGITAILPVAVLGKNLKKSDDEIAKALAISHISTSFVKRRLGRMSVVCGCSVAAGAGSAAGMAYLMGASADQMADAMQLLLSNLAGMLCDGAKESCALKVSSASSEAYFAARWAVAGQKLGIPQGVFGSSIEETIENVARVTREGMKNVDRVIIEILDQRHRPSAENF